MSAVYEKLRTCLESIQKKVDFKPEVDVYKRQPGQFTVGAYVAILIGVKCTFLPAGLHCFVAIAGAALAGALWGMVPGLLKAFRNVNEVIASIMMNYIGMYMVNMLIQRTIYDQVKNQSCLLYTSRCV